MTEALHGQVAIVTGAAQGLGYAIAKAYASVGMKLALIDIDAGKLTSVANELDSETLVLAADLSKSYATQAAIQHALEHFGTPRVVVHNAAILKPHSLLDVTLDEWQLTVNVGIQAAFQLSQAVWQGMTDAGHGSIVFVSSQSGIKGFEDETAYCTAKHGLEGLMKSLALEGKSRNIAVNTITPGMYMHTPMSEQNYPDDLKQKWVDPLLLTPAFIQLAQQDASGMSGERLDAWKMSESIRSGE